MKPLNIFKPGRWLPMGASEPIEFSEADLRQAVNAYNPALHRAPIVIGHPKLTDPAYGHISRLSYGLDGLDAHPENVEPAFAELVAKEAFPSLSAGWYPPSHPRNPMPGTWYLREVSFLGAVPPAVRGLRKPTFAAFAAGDSDDGIIRFGCDEDSVSARLWRGLKNWLIGQFGQESADKALDESDLSFLAAAAAGESAIESTEMQPDPAAGRNFAGGFSVSPSQEQSPTMSMTPEQIAQMQAENARLRQDLATSKAAEAAREAAALRGGAVEFAEGLIAEGRLKPKHKQLLSELIVQIATPAADGKVVQFAADDGPTRPLVEAVKGFLKAALPKQVEFGEFAGADRADRQPAKNPLVADAERRATEAKR